MLVIYFIDAIITKIVNQRESNGLNQLFVFLSNYAPWIIESSLQNDRTILMQVKEISSHIFSLCTFF